MKAKLATVAALAAAFLALTAQQFPRPVYLWQHAIQVTEDGIDSTFVLQWEQVSFWASGPVRVRLGAPDTRDWSQRPWLQLGGSQVLSIGPAPHLKRLQVQALSDTVTLYMVGLKRERQF